MSLTRRRNPFPVLILAVVLAQCGVVHDLTEPGTLSIQKFAAAPPDIAVGSATTLSWDVTGADKVEIDNGIGTVDAKGTRQVRPEWTTSFNLVARAGTSQATASVQVRVVPASGASPSPSPAASPSPSPSPSATPSPAPSPTASPSSSPPPMPVPTPTPMPVSCGEVATLAGSCGLTVVHDMNQGCIELTAVSFDQSCPVAPATWRALHFKLTAHTTRTGLRWRRSATSSDVLSPSEGDVSSDGNTKVDLSDLALDRTVTIEVVAGSKVVLAFTLRHY